MLFAIDPPRPTNSNSQSNSGESSIDHDRKLPSSSLSSRRQPFQTQQQTHAAESHADTARATATDPQHQDETHTLLLAAPAISVSNSRAGGLPVASLWPAAASSSTGPGFHRTNTNSTNQTTTSTADAVSVVSASSNSNISASSIHATPSTGSTTALLVTGTTVVPPPLMPMNNTNTNNSTRNHSNHSRSNHSRSSVNTTTMNVEAMMNRNTSAGSITSMASFPPAQAQQSQSDEANPFPTLLQVRQQSQSHLERRRMLLLTDDQKATLDRVTRLSARMLGLPVAIISGMMMENTTTGTASPQVISEHGLNEVPWREQALALLRQQQQPQQQGMPFCEHVPLVHVASTQPQVVVGTLSLMGLQARSALSKDEQESLQDLAFLATQVLSNKRKGSHHRREFTPSLPTGSAVQRQVSNASSSDLRQVQQQQSPTPPPPPQPRRRRSMRSKKRSSFNANASSQDRMDYRSDDDQHDEDDFNDDDENDYYQDDDDPSKCIIACTAHDLLTPLMGLQLSLSLLQDDAKFVRHLEEQPHQRESFWTAWQSTEVMFRMCQTTIDSLRANKHAQQQAERRRRRCVDASRRSPTPPPPVVVTQVCNLDLTVLLQSLQRLMDPIPKQVPLIITLPKHVPTLVPVITTMTQQQQPESTSGSQQQHYLISNNNSTATSANSVDWNILRCALTVLSHACRSSHQQQQGPASVQPRPRKPIHMRMALERNDGQQRDETTQYRLVIECDHECPPPQDQGDDDDQQQGGEGEEDSTTLALQSVAHQMQSVHGGRHGFARCDDDASRAVFWFSVPVGDDLSSAKYNRDDRVVTLMPPPPPQQQPQQSQLASQAQAAAAPQPLMRSRMTKPESPPPTIHEQKQQRGGLFSTSPKNTSPGRPRSGLRRLRRSSTGSTNTLGSRVRTFHDMAGLHNETYGRAGNGAVGNRGMTTSTSTTRFGTTIPSVLPTTLLPRSQSQYPARSTPLTSLSGHKRNFQYPRSSVTNNNNGSGNATTTTTTTTANTAMAAAFQASLSASVAASAFLVASTSGMDDSSTVDRAARSRLSYSLLQEQQQLDREKLRPMHLQSSARQSSTASQTQPGGHASSTSSSSGLDRCFQDLMGNSDQSTQRVRERLLSSTTGTSATTSVVGTPKATSKPVLSTPASLLLSPNSNNNNAGVGRERKALVIEDSLVIRKTVARALTKKMGIQTVVQACDGVEGVARLKEDVFDIVLCDFSMPNLGGIECVQQYRQWEKEQSFSSLMSTLNRPATANRPRQYIVGMSAHASPSDIAQGLKVGMNEYRPKPLTIPRLTELMESPPLQEMRKQLDAWAQKQAMGDTIIGSPSASKVQRKESLFADFTSSTVSMLDAMNSTTARPTPFSATMVGTGSHSSGGSMSRPLDGGGSMKRPKTEGLFSMITN